MKKLALLFLMTPLMALVSLTTTADISGDAAAHQIAASGGARWIQFVCPSTNTSAVRIGDSNVSTSRGVPCAAGGSLFLPPLPATPADGINQPAYDLSTIYYLVQSGDKLSITRANP